MTIRIYPSRLPGEPLETHEHGSLTLHQWFTGNVRNYCVDDPQPIAVEIDDRSIPPSEWALCQIRPDSDVKIYPVPYAVGFAIASLVIAVASAAYSIYMMNNMDTGGYTSSNGIGLDLNPAKANNARLGDPIRELFGRYRFYPDYVVQPVTRFDPDDPTRMIVEMLICLGVGDIAFTNGDNGVPSRYSPILPFPAGQITERLLSGWVSLPLISRLMLWLNTVKATLPRLAAAHRSASVWTLHKA